MSIPAVHIFFMWQVFFVAAEQIKRCSKNIKGEISPLGFEKCFIIIYFKTINTLRLNIVFKKQGYIAKPEFII